MGNKSSSKSSSAIVPKAQVEEPNHSKSLQRIFSVTSLFTDINLIYAIDHKEVGHGQYGIVRTATNKKTNERVAVKSIPKDKVNDISRLRVEIEILQTLDHPNIVKFKDFFEDNRYFHIVTEYCEGGELFERIIEKTKYSEEEAAKVMRDLFGAVEYCHNHHIVHRDLKPENLLYLTKSDNSPIKIIDFGLSKKDDESLRTRVGTPFYIAPEIMKKEYGRECDIWSIGVILYILLCGYPPFFGNNDAEILRKVQRGSYTMEGKDWDHISEEAKDIIRNLLQVDPKDRYTAGEALKHPWINNNNAVRIDLVDRLIKFSGHCKLKRAAIRVIADTLTSNQITELQEAFRDIDTEKTGSVTLEQLRIVLEQRDMHQLADVHESLYNIKIPKDSLIDYNELLASTLKRSTYLTHEKMYTAFRHFDRDGNGFISPDDMKSVLGRESNLDEYFVGVSKKGEFRIDFNEFCEMMAASTPALGSQPKIWS